MKSPSANQSLAYLGLLYVGILILQATRSMYLDAYSEDGTRLDLIGFAINAAIGVQLTANALQRRAIFFEPLKTIAVFIVLLTVNVVFNANDSILSVILSRYGILSWLLIGMWSALAIRAIRNNIGEASAKWYPWIGVIFLALCFVPVVVVSAKYISDRLPTLNYQIVASNAIVVICISMIALRTLSTAPGGVATLSNLVTYGFLGVASFLVYAVALMQSTGVVAFWGGALPLMLLAITARTRLLPKITFAVVIGLFLYGGLSEFVLVDLFQNTRLEALNDTLLSVNSIETRIDLLPLFMAQFEVAPIFGDYNAEVSAGFLLGEYAHSLPLSLLSHTGIIGFLLLLEAWIVIFLQSRKNFDFTDPNSRLIFRLFILISILATAFAFFSWAPLWFFLGYMCVRAARKSESMGVAV